MGTAFSFQSQALGSTAGAECHRFPLLHKSELPIERGKKWSELSGVLGND
jgi:hypothetical protein